MARPWTFLFCAHFSFLYIYSFLLASSSVTLFYFILAFPMCSISESNVNWQMTKIVCEFRIFSSHSECNLLSLLCASSKTQLALVALCTQQNATCSHCSVHAAKRNLLSFLCARRNLLSFLCASSKTQLALVAMCKQQNATCSRFSMQAAKSTVSWVLLSNPQTISRF